MSEAQASAIELAEQILRRQDERDLFHVSAKQKRLLAALADRTSEAPPTESSASTRSDERTPQEEPSVRWSEEHETQEEELLAKGLTREEIREMYEAFGGIAGV